MELHLRGPKHEQVHKRIWAKLRLEPLPSWWTLHRPDGRSNSKKYEAGRKDWGRKNLLENWPRPCLGKGKTRPNPTRQTTPRRKKPNSNGTAELRKDSARALVQGLARQDRQRAEESGWENGSHRWAGIWPGSTQPGERAGKSKSRGQKIVGVLGSSALKSRAENGPRPKAKSEMRTSKYLPCSRRTNQKNYRIWHGRLNRVGRKYICRKRNRKHLESSRPGTDVSTENKNGWQIDAKIETEYREIQSFSGE
jgi:hypothetical protein